MYRKSTFNKYGIFFLIGIMWICVSLLACKNDGNDKESGEDYGYFEEDDVETPQSETDADVEVGTINVDETMQELKYSGDFVEVEIRYVNHGKPCELGTFLFTDGVAQPYFFNDEDKERLIRPIELKEGEEVRFNVRFIPVMGRKGKTVQVNMATMLNPSMCVKSKTGMYGNNHKVLSRAPMQLICKEDYGRIDVKVNENVIPVSEEYKKLYNYEYKDGSVRNTLEDSCYINLVNDNEILDNYTVVNGKINIHLHFLGGFGMKWRVSTFVNHIPVSAFDGDEYIDVEFSQKDMADIPITIDTKDLRLEEYNFLYVMAVPFVDRYDAYAKRLMKSTNIILMD